MGETAKNVVLVGDKPSVRYATAVVTQANRGEDKIIIKARGRKTGKAIDVSQIVVRKFLPGFRVNSVTIGTDELDSAERGKINVSTIIIELVKKEMEA